MIHWPRRYALDVFVVGKRLVLLLLAVAAYYVTVSIVVQNYQLQLSAHGDAGSLINTIILGLLMSFRNRAAYQRWWEARGLWGQLINDSRNLAAKCAAFLPADVLARSGMAEVLASFPDSLKRHLRKETFRLRDVPGFEQKDADPQHVPLYLARQLFGVIADWKSNGHIDRAVFGGLDAHARGLLDVCGGCERIRNTPLSPSYKGLLRTGLLLNVLVAPWMIVPEHGLWSLPVILLACFFLFGVELIDSIVEEPFGKDRDDLDLEGYCQIIREDVTAILRT